MSILEQIQQGVITHKADLVKESVTKALDEGIPAEKILSDGLIAGMAVIGEKFKNNKIFVPEVLMAAKSTHAGMDVINPILSQSKNSIGTMVLGTVKGDLHDIGKNLVGMMMEGAGFEVIDLGMDVAPETFVEEVKKHNAQIVGLSVLITNTAPAVGETLKAFEEAGLRDKVKIIVGGAAITKAFAEEVGVDGYGANASEAVEVAKQLIS